MEGRLGPAMVRCKGRLKLCFARAATWVAAMWLQMSKTVVRHFLSGLGTSVNGGQRPTRPQNLYPTCTIYPPVTIKRSSNFVSSLRIIDVVTNYLTRISYPTRFNLERSYKIVYRLVGHAQIGAVSSDGF